MNSHGKAHAEVWDDSALVDSWDEAVNEYKVSIPRCIQWQATITNVE